MEKKKEKWTKIPEFEYEKKEWKKKLLETCKKNEIEQPSKNIIDSLYFMVNTNDKSLIVNKKWVKKQVYIYGLERVCVEFPDTPDEEKFQLSFSIPDFSHYKDHLDQEDAKYKKTINLMKRREKYKNKNGLRKMFSVDIDAKTFNYRILGTSYTYKIKDGVVFVSQGLEIVKIYKKWDSITIYYEDEWDEDE